MRHQLSRLLHAPHYLIAVAICALPQLRRFKLHALSIQPTTRWARYWQRFVRPVWYRMEFAPADPMTQERLKVDMIFGGESGRRWAEYYASRSFAEELEGTVGVLPYREACPVYPAIERLCEDGNSWTVVEIGSSSGRELAHYARRYPNIQFIGVDIVPEAVAFANAQHHASNLQFMVGDAKHLRAAVESRVRRSVVVMSSGSLQYIGPGFIGAWYRELCDWSLVRHVLVNEGVRLTHGPPDELHGSATDASWAVTHDYRWYAEAAGWRTAACAIIRPYLPGDPVHGQSATYFHHATR